MLHARTNLLQQASHATLSRFGAHIDDSGWGSGEPYLSHAFPYILSYEDVIADLRRGAGLAHG